MPNKSVSLRRVRIVWRSFAVNQSARFGIVFVIAFVALFSLPRVARARASHSIHVFKDRRYESNSKLERQLRGYRQLWNCNFYEWESTVAW